MSRKRGAGDEGNEDEKESIEIPPAESLSISTTVSTVLAVVDKFMFTESFMLHFVKYVPRDTLIRLRLATKGYRDAADALIDEGVESGVMIVHDGRDFSFNEQKLDARGVRS
ncbi:hypothetical protein TL16_g10199 [Triparma laevis f. inornata]|uniref:Uncharacterized protein n=1 Tax=Triparma laevis f. inornata TaxID=1714386 RepID=A0A9W7BFR4_9STRA|nr:hypothetical protein TL16_g10199 [Triparma laevis f. inornata]